MCVCVFNLCESIQTGWSRTRTHRQIARTSTTMANNLDSCIVVTFECGTIEIHNDNVRACSMGAIFVNVSTVRAKEKRMVTGMDKALDKARRRMRAKFGLKWPIHLQCPSFIVCIFWMNIELHVCGHAALDPSKNPRTSTIVCHIKWSIFSFDTATIHTHLTVYLYSLLQCTKLN